MRVPILLVFTVTVCALQAQLTPQLLSVLDASLAENSGLLYVGGELWTHTDGNGPAALLQIDPSTGQITRTVDLSNASNIDWEDVTSDGVYVYVGDFGNNAGSRTDLRVYRFPVDSLLDPLVQAVTVDTITFDYADQTTFTPSPFITNWDMEAMIALNDTLFLFSKNWGDQHTYLYALPTTPGQYSIVARDTLNAQGLITGADIDATTGRIVLTGVEFVLPFDPFIWTLDGYSGHDLFGGINTRTSLTVNDIQLEGVAFRTTDSLYISNETFQSSPARLWTLLLANPTGLAIDHSIPERLVVEHPWGWALQIPQPNTALLQVVDSSGRLVYQRTLLAGGPHTLQRKELPCGPLILSISSGDQRAVEKIMNR